MEEDKETITQEIKEAKDKAPIIETPKEIKEQIKEAVKDKPKSIIEEAKEERLKNVEVLENMKEEREKLEKLNVEMQLAGKSTMIQEQEPTEQEAYSKKAEERYKGTGLNPALGFKRKF